MLIGHVSENTLLESLRKDNGNFKVNVTNQEYDWLNEEKNRAARAARFNFCEIFLAWFPNLRL